MNTSERLDISGYEGLYQLDGNSVKQVEQSFLIPYGNRRAKLIILERYVHTVVNEHGQTVYRLWKDHHYEDLTLDDIKARAIPLKESREDTFNRLAGLHVKSGSDENTVKSLQHQQDTHKKLKPKRLF